MSMSAFASYSNYGPGELVDFDENIGAAVADEYIKVGSSLENTRNFDFIPLDQYYQDGESWSNDLMQTADLPIGAYGCGLTSFAMILSHYATPDDPDVNFSYDPGEVNELVGWAACPLSYSAIASPFSLAIHANKAITSTSQAEHFIVGSIEDNKPVLVYMRHSSGSTHFVVASGYANSGNIIYIDDPEPAWNYDTLEQYTKNNWSIVRTLTYR